MDWVGLAQVSDTTGCIITRRIIMSDVNLHKVRLSRLVFTLLFPTFNAATIISQFRGCKWPGRILIKMSDDSVLESLNFKKLIKSWTQV